MLKKRGILGRIDEIFHSLLAMKRIFKESATPSFLKTMKFILAKE
jgi:hypothetical protein